MAWNKRRQMTERMTSYAYWLVEFKGWAQYQVAAQLGVPPARISEAIKEMNAEIRSGHFQLTLWDWKPS